MVFHLLAMGAVVLVGRGVAKGVESYERKKSQRTRQINQITESNIPKGYAPQQALLFDYPLQPGEDLIATFEFTACKWTKEMFASSEMFPRTFGMTLGIGHITSDRILLFYDLKTIFGKSHWSSEQMETCGKWGSKIIEHGVNETLGHLFESFAHIDSETREHMEKVAKHFGPYGVVACPRGGDWGLAYSSVFFKMTNGSPNKSMTFAPAFIDSSASGDEFDIFKKILSVGKLPAEIEKMISFPYFGSRKELERDMF